MQSLLKKLGAFGRVGAPKPRRLPRRLPRVLEFDQLEDRCLPSTATWIGPAGGDWGVASNWSTSMVPGAADKAVIGAGSSVVLTEANLLVGGLSLASTASLNLTTDGSLDPAGSLTVLGKFTDQGSLNVDSGSALTVASAATLAIQGDLAITGGGSLTNLGTIQVQSTTLGSSISTNNFTNDGTVNLQTGNLALEAPNVFSDAGSLSNFVVAPNTVLDLTGGQTVTYQGNFAGSGGGTIQLSSGAFEVNAGLAPVTLNFANTGGLSANTGGLSWTGGFFQGFGDDGGPAQVTNLGTIVFPSGGGGELDNINLYNQGQLVLQGSATLDDPNSESSQLLNYGEVLKTGSGEFDVYYGVQFVNEPSGTVEASGDPSSSLVFYYVSSSNLYAFNLERPGISISNYDSEAGQTLQYGTWEARDGAQLEFPSIDGVEEIAPGTTVILDGAGSSLQYFFPDPNALNDLSFVDSGATLEVLNGASVPTYYDLQNDGTVVLGTSSALGSQLMISGVFYQTPSGTLEVQVGGTPQSGLFGQIQTNPGNSLSSSMLGGTVIATLANGFTPSANEVYPVITTPTAGGLNGTFATAATAPFLTLYDGQTFFLIGAAPSDPPLIIAGAAQYLVPPETPPDQPPSNPDGPPAPPFTPVAPPFSGPGLDPLGTTPPELGGGGGETPPEVTSVVVKLGPNAIVIGQFFQNQPFIQSTQPVDLGSKFGEPSSPFAPPSRKSSFADIALLPPVIRFAIASAGVGPGNMITSMNETATNVSQFDAILRGFAEEDVTDGAPLLDENAPRDARSAPAPVESGPGDVSRIGNGAGEDDPAAYGRMLAALGLAHYYISTSLLANPSPSGSRTASVSARPSPRRSSR